MGEPVLNLRLWELADAVVEIGAELMDAGGELSPELEARLDAIDASFEGKVERVALYIRELEVTADAAAAEAKRLAAMAAARGGAAKRLKEYLKQNLERTGKQRVETDRVRLRLQKNSRPSITWARSIDDLPERYARITVALDGQRAYDDWKAGELPSSFTVETGTHLRIE